MANVSGGIVVKTSRYASAADEKRKLALLPRHGGVEALRREAKVLGFEQIGRGQWKHEDGSWLQFQNGTYTHGVGSTRLFDLPEPKVAAPVDKSVKLSRERPDIERRSWSWFKAHTQLGKTPVLQDDGWGRINLMRLGYVSHGRSHGRETFVHPDGSWFKLASGSVSCGWKGYNLGELPFQRG